MPLSRNSHTRIQNIIKGGIEDAISNIEGVASEYDMYTTAEEQYDVQDEYVDQPFLGEPAPATDENPTIDIRTLKKMVTMKVRQRLKYAGQPENAALNSGNTLGQVDAHLDIDEEDVDYEVPADELGGGEFVEIEEENPIKSYLKGRTMYYLQSQVADIRNSL